MELEHGLISVDDHVQETPETWSAYMSAQKWGDLIPHLEDREDGSQAWVVAGHRLDDRPLAETGALMPDRNQSPQRWEDVPSRRLRPRPTTPRHGRRRRRLPGPLPQPLRRLRRSHRRNLRPRPAVGLRPGLQQLAHRRVEERQPPVHSPMPRTHLLPPGSRHRSLPRRRPRTSWRHHARHPLGPAGRSPHQRSRVGPPLDRRARTCKSPSASTPAQPPKCGSKPGRVSPPSSPTP